MNTDETGWPGRTLGMPAEYIITVSMRPDHRAAKEEPAERSISKKCDLPILPLLRGSSNACYENHLS